MNSVRLCKIENNREFALIVFHFFKKQNELFQENEKKSTWWY